MKRKIIIATSAVLVAVAILLVVFIIPQTRVVFTPKITIGIWEDGALCSKLGDEWVGYDVSVTSKIFKDLGYKVEYIEIKYDEADKALASKKIDCYITSQKGYEENIYSKSYCSISQGTLYKGVLPIYSEADFANYSIGIRNGMADREAIANYTNSQQIQIYSTTSDLLAMLESDVIDICILDYYYIDEIINTNAYSAYTSGILVESRDKVLALREGEENLIKKVNDKIDVLMREEYFNTLKYGSDLNGYIS